MQLRRTVFLFVFLLLVGLPVVSGAASPKSDTSGLCCANETLKNSTKKQCEKNKGKFYSLKERAKAQKECRSKRSASSSNTIAPAQNEVEGFCCIDGTVKKASTAKCRKMKGSYYRSSALAKQACKAKNVFCCVDGSISERSSSECKKQKGTAYKTAAEAKRKCKPADLFCCVNGKIKKSSPKQCKQQKGSAYKTVAEAKRKCKQADVYCCVKGTVRKMSPKQCDGRKATAYKTRTQANKECRKVKNGKTDHLSQRDGGATGPRKGHPGVTSTSGKFGKKPGYSDSSWTAVAGYCCSDRKVSQKSQKKCEQTKGVYFKSRINAEKACHTKKAGVTATAGKSGQMSQLVRGMSARATGRTGRATAAVMNSRVMNVEISRGEESGVKPTLEAMRTCKVNGWVAINGLAPTVPVSLRLTSLGNGGQTPPHVFRLPLDGSFSLVVVEGTHRLQPLFANASAQEEQISIAAREFICQPDIFPEIAAPFTWPESSSATATPPPMCAVSGKVSNTYGTGLNEITGIVVSNTSSGTEKAAEYLPATASYQIEIPAGSSYKITAQFEEGSRLTTVDKNFVIAPEQMRKVVDVEVDRAEQFCSVSGTILVDGVAPMERLRVNVSPAGGGQPQHLMTSGAFSFRVPEGTYNVEPLFPLGSIYGEGIPAKQFLCQVDLAEEVVIDFNYVSPPVCVLSGRVSGVGSLTLRSLAPGGATIPISVEGDEYRVSIPSGASYVLTPNARRGRAIEEDAIEFTIYPSQRSHIVNFERNQEGFRFGRLQVEGFDKNRQIDSLNGMLKFTIETLANGNGGRYNRSVRITSPGNSELDMFRNCSFGPSGKCEFSLYLDGFNLERDSIKAEIIDYENEIYGTQIYATPFRGLGGDLRPSKYFIIKDGDETVSWFGVRNISTTSDSAACRMDVRLGGGRSHRFQVPALAAGEEHIIQYVSRSWEPRIGNVLSFQVDNSCDGYSYNNRFSHTVTSNQYFDSRSEDVTDFFDDGAVGFLGNVGSSALGLLDGTTVSDLFNSVSDFLF